MNFIRPELRSAAWRWREVLTGLAASAIGVWWALAARGILPYLGVLLVAAGAVLVFVGVQRGRFRSGAGGPGVVQVDEGQIAYFGPLTGGVVALEELSALSLDPTARPPHWVLSQTGAADLAVPVNAEGADALFDAFAQLPGLRTGRMLAELERPSSFPVLIWEREGTPRPARLN